MKPILGSLQLLIQVKPGRSKGAPHPPVALKVSREFGEILKVESPLPIKRFGSIMRRWIRLQASGLLNLAKIKDGTVEVDAYRILDATHGMPLIRATFSYRGVPAAACSMVSVTDVLQRAFGEFCENLQVFSDSHVLGQTRSGFAVGVDEGVARTRAYRELIERDSLITHFLCPEVKSCSLAIPKYAVLPVKLARLWSADPIVQVVLCGIQHREGDLWFLGAGAEQTKEGAVEKAYTECIATYCSYANAANSATLIGPRQSLILKHINASKELIMRVTISSIFNGFRYRNP